MGFVPESFWDAATGAYPLAFEPEGGGSDVAQLAHHGWGYWNYPHVPTVDRFKFLTRGKFLTNVCDRWAQRARHCRRRRRRAATRRRRAAAPPRRRAASAPPSPPFPRRTTCSRRGSTARVRELGERVGHVERHRAARCRGHPARRDDDAGAAPAACCRRPSGSRTRPTSSPDIFGSKFQRHTHALHAGQPRASRLPPPSSCPGRRAAPPPRRRRRPAGAAAPPPAPSRVPSPPPSIRRPCRPRRATQMAEARGAATAGSTAGGAELTRAPCRRRRRRRPRATTTSPAPMPTRATAARRSAT